MTTTAPELVPAFTFTIPGVPEGQRRARAVRRGAHAGMHDDPRNGVYADRVRWAWRDGTGSDGVGDYPCTVTVEAVFPRPASHYTATGKLSASGKRAPWPGRKPDADNIAKAICDALNGYAWTDDAQVVGLHVVKRWAGPDEWGCVRVTAQALRVGVDWQALDGGL